MNKINISNLVDFSRKGAKGKQTIATKFKSPAQVKLENDEGGGNYWISALSSISNTFKNEENQIGQKIDELIEKIEAHHVKTVKDMYQQNINILNDFEEFNFKSLRPKAKLTFQKRPKEKSIVIVEDLPLFADPNHVFTFNAEGEDLVGSIWFIAKKNGLTLKELSLASELMHKYLQNHYSEKFTISKDYCIAVDVISLNILTLSEMDFDKKSSLHELVSEIKSLL